MLGYIGRHLLEQFALVRGKKAREVVFIRLGSASGHSKKMGFAPECLQPTQSSHGQSSEPL